MGVIESEDPLVAAELAVIARMSKEEKELIFPPAIAARLEFIGKQINPPVEGAGFQRGDSLVFRVKE